MRWAFSVVKCFPASGSHRWVELVVQALGDDALGVEPYMISPKQAIRDAVVVERGVGAGERHGHDAVATVVHDLNQVNRTA